MLLQNLDFCWSCSFNKKNFQFKNCICFNPFLCTYHGLLVLALPEPGVEIIVLERVSWSDWGFRSLTHTLRLGPSELTICILGQLALAKLLFLTLRWPPLKNKNVSDFNQNRFCKKKKLATSYFVKWRSADYMECYATARPLLRESMDF